MDLLLEIISYHKYANSTEVTKSLTLSDKCKLFTLGRSENSDWYLPDPDRTISSEHAQVFTEEGKYFIRDTSTNGLFINGSENPVGRNNCSMLKMGDVVKISDYEIKVTLNESEDEYSLATKDPSWEEESIDINDKREHELHDFGISTHSLLSNVGAARTLESDLDDNFQLPTHLERASDHPETIPEDWSLAIDSNPQKTDELTKNVDISNKEISTSEHLENRDVYNLFVKGLKVNPDMIPDANDERFWLLMGASVRTLFEGITDTLQKRSEFKQKKRLNQTLFQRTENNPIKFSGTFEDLLHNLFIRDSSSFMGPEDAIKEAFEDLKNHEEALQAGLEGSIKGLLDLLEPKKIMASTEVDKTWYTQMFGIGKKESWDNYLNIHNSVTKDIGSYKFYIDDFNNAYEKHLSNKRGS